MVYIVSKRIIQVLLLLGALAWTFSYFQKDKLPAPEQIDERLYQEPQQTKTEATPFIKQTGDIEYTIKPLFDYELYGLVGSFHNSESWWDYYHQEWSDYLNVKDLCVIWGDNIKSGVYQDMKFASGSWTCYAEFKSGTNQVEWDKFKYSQLSNNHLLAGEKDMNKQIMAAQTGDQVHLKGYLAEYSHGSGFERGSSISRTDRGNGACETIYVTDFEIIKKGEEIWWYVYRYVRYIIAVCLILLFISLFRDPAKNGEDE
ncbi:hypothetical protein KJ903_00155 [Patescibacteria group bacterium]|nr:hypothetical protein [Patescibacteria group bacterium]